MATASGGHEEVTAHNFHGSRVALSDRASSLHAAWRRDTADSLEKWNVPLSGGGVCDCCSSGFRLCSSLPLPLPLLTRHKRGSGLEEAAISAFGSVLERPLTPRPPIPGSAESASAQQVFTEHPQRASCGGQGVSRSWFRSWAFYFLFLFFCCVCSTQNSSRHIVGAQEMFVN